jgi:hypothetical protein
MRLSAIKLLSALDRRPPAAKVSAIKLCNQPFIAPNVLSHPTSPIQAESKRGMMRKIPQLANSKAAA